MDQPNPSGPTDDELIAAARADQPEAFETLIRRHESRVLRVLRLMGVRHQDLEDVAQEVFVRVFRHLPRYRPGRSFSAWIYRISVNAAHDEYQRRSRRREGPWVDGEGGEDPQDPAPGPDADLDRLQRRQALELALQRISPRERAVFVLCELEGLSTLQVAKALKITRVTVRRHLSRARGHLRQVLTQEDQKTTTWIERLGERGSSS